MTFPFKNENDIKLYILNHPEFHMTESFYFFSSESRELAFAVAIYIYYNMNEFNDERLTYYVLFLQYQINDKKFNLNNIDDFTIYHYYYENEYISRDRIGTILESILLEPKNLSEKDVFTIKQIMTMSNETLLKIQQQYEYGFKVYEYENSLIQKRLAMILILYMNSRIDWEDRWLLQKFIFDNLLSGTSSIDIILFTKEYDSSCGLSFDMKIINKLSKYQNEIIGDKFKNRMDDFKFLPDIRKIFMISGYFYHYIDIFKLTLSGDIYKITNDETNIINTIKYISKYLDINFEYLHGKNSLSSLLHGISTGNSEIIVNLCNFSFICGSISSKISKNDKLNKYLLEYFKEISQKVQYYITNLK